MSSLKNFKFQKEDDDQLLEDEEQNVPKLVRETNRDEHMRKILKSIEAGHLFNQSEEEEDPKSDPIITISTISTTGRYLNQSLILQNPWVQQRRMSSLKIRKNGK